MEGILHEGNTHDTTGMTQISARKRMPIGPVSSEYRLSSVNHIELRISKHQRSSGDFFLAFDVILSDVTFNGALLPDCHLVG